MRNPLVTLAGAVLVALAVGACGNDVSGSGAPAPGGQPSAAATPTDQPTKQSDEPSESSPSESGPGGDRDAEKQAVAGVAERWYRALGAKDGSGACNLMTATAQTQIQGGKSCEEFVSQNPAAPALLEAFRRIEVDADRVLVLSGGRATVLSTAVSSPGVRLTDIPRLRLVRTGDDWLVNSTS